MIKNCAIGIDLGSNTLRAVKIDCKSKEFGDSFERIVKTADRLEESGKISQDALRRIEEALKELLVNISFDSCAIRAVTTEALRRAENSRDIIEKINREFGIKFEIISAKEEAFLTLLAVSKRLEKLSLGSDNFVMVDIGGGSTEIALYKNAEVISESFPVGIVTIAQKYPNLKSLRENLPIEMKDMKEFVESLNISSDYKFVSTAGTPTTVAAVKLGMDYQSYDPKRINGTILNVDDLEETLNYLLKLDEKSRQKAVGVGRSDLILAGILIFEEIFNILKVKESIVIDDGLREGVALSLCGEKIES